MNKSWEELCSHCTLCCHKKTYYEEKGVIELDLTSPCSFLNKEKKECSVYKNRFKECKECQKVNLCRVLFSPFLPPECSYVLWARKKGIRKAKKIPYIIREN